MTPEELIARLNKELPGEDAHMAFSPIRGKSSEIIQNYPNPKESAVAIVLYFKANQIHTLVTERQTYNGQHSGQISFPGGKKEPSDTDLLATAQRECFEEIGLFLETQSYQVDLTPVFIPVSNFIIFPKVFLTSEPVGLIKSVREVAEIHELNLHQLFKEDAIIYRDIQVNEQLKLKNIPHFSQKNVAVWGATALILNELKALLMLD